MTAITKLMKHFLCHKGVTVQCEVSMSIIINNNNSAYHHSTDNYGKSNIKELHLKLITKPQSTQANF